jgi:hypothetical protein
MCGKIFSHFTALLLKHTQSVVQEPYKYKATERLKAISELS